MRDGRIVQVGTWTELTGSPADEWVTRFLGA
jgi:ABC-type proline/glycine betaine transport system ATPase subunit